MVYRALPKLLKRDFKKAYLQLLNMYLLYIFIASVFYKFGSNIPVKDSFVNLLQVVNMSTLNLNMTKIVILSM